MRFYPVAHPVLAPAEAKTFEQAFFKGDEQAEWTAMQAAGRAVGHEVVRDFLQRQAWPTDPRILVLIGKGHNGGDALLAAETLLTEKSAAVATLLFFAPEKDLRPLTARAYRQLTHRFGDRVRATTLDEIQRQTFDVWLDGVFGFQFHAPLDERTAECFERLEKLSVGMRVAVDLPSGLSDARALRADFTYATGSVKTPVLAPDFRGKVGRLRYLDLGFFREKTTTSDGPPVLCRETLNTLRGWRDAHGDKRSYGHLFVIGGSRSFPGAVMMATRAALEAGAGLLTSFVPESLLPAYAAQVPEAMWVGCPETESGGISLEALHLVRERAKRANALVIGPGMARDPETLAFIKEVLKAVDLPTVIDADALQPDIVTKGAKPRIVTPHAGEFKRLAGEKSAEEYARETGVVTVLKGTPTRITDGSTSYLSLAGSPVLARGGSGDMLSGITGTLLAQDPENALSAAATAVFWHGTAAEALARTCGETCVRATQLLDFLPAVIRDPRDS